MILLILYLLPFLNLSSPLAHTPKFPKIYVAEHIEEKLVIDGFFSEPAWQNAKWSDLFIDIEGEQSPKLNTRVKMVYNDSFLYIGAYLQEPHVTAFLQDKNKPIFRYDNDFEVFIDPDGDNCNYYELELNAINTIWELSLPYPYRAQGKPQDPDNMPGMMSSIAVEGSINKPDDQDKFWTVEIAFPLAGMLKYGSKTSFDIEEYWRINFSRVQWDYEVLNNTYIRMPNHSEHNWVWSPQYEINMHAPEHWGYLFFKQPSNLERIISQWNIEQKMVDAFLLWKKGKLGNNNREVIDSNIFVIKNIAAEELLLEYNDQESGCRYYIDHHSKLWNVCDD